MNFIVPKERSLYLSGEVNYASMKLVTEQIISINENDLVVSKVYNAYGLSYMPQPIKLFIDSFGGYLYPCTGLCSVMEASKTPVDTYVTGSAFSAGFIIGISGKTRYAYKNSWFCYHQLSSATFGELKTMIDDVEQKKKLQAMMEAIVKKKTDIKEKDLRNIALMKIDKYFDSSEAIEKKIVDIIL